MTQWVEKYQSPDAENNDPAGNAVRCLRGGSWKNFVSSARAAARNRLNPNYGDLDWGFRVVMSVPIKTSENLDSDPSDL